MRWLAVLACLLVAACTSPAARSETRPLTAPEADAFALARFTMYRLGAVGIDMSIPAQGGTWRLTGRVDWRSHLGYGILYTGASRPDLAQWDLTSLGILGQWPGELPAEPPADGWQTRPLRRHSSTLDTALLLVLNLGSDRPDNAQLLGRSSARWLRQEDVGGTTTMVVSGPASGEQPTGNTRYWIGPDNRILRFAAKPHADNAWISVNLYPGTH